VVPADSPLGESCGHRTRHDCGDFVVFVLPVHIRGHVDNPYVGIIIFLILPIVFFIGLALIPIGIYLSKRNIRKGLAESSFDRKTVLRRLAWFFGVTTLPNILIGTQFKVSDFTSPTR
jgi:hypothetical protein